MRVTRSRDENGAVAVFVAICAILLFATTAYALDAGNLWQARRHVSEGADAASLGAAGSLAVGGTTNNACETVAPQLLTANMSNADVTNCEVAGQGLDHGYATVRGKTTVDYAFRGIWGDDANDVFAATTSEWGIPYGVSGLRPFGLCLTANPQLQAWLNLPTGPTGQSGEITITYSKAQPDSCGANVPGNWGVMDFDGGANSNNDIKDWTREGYPGEIDIPSTVLGDTGAFSNSLDTELTYLKNSGEFFGLPVFDSALGNGSGAQFHVIAVVYVKLIDFRANGTQAQRYMTLVFDRGVMEGRCCNPNGIDTGVRALRICDVDTLNPNTSDPRAC